jgi:hypothetical protein
MRATARPARRTKVLINAVTAEVRSSLHMSGLKGTKLDAARLCALSNRFHAFSSGASRADKIVGNRKWLSAVMRSGSVTAKIRNWTLGFILLAGSATGCERPTHVRIQGAGTPVFILSGSGRLETLAVYTEQGLQKSNNPFDDSFAVWEIKPILGDPHGTPVEDLESISYGVVPPGYVQVKPSSGSPVSLTEGQKYFYEVITTGAPWAEGYFEIRNSRAQPTTGPGVCFGRKDGKWIRVPCPKI